MAKKLRLLADSYEQPQKDDKPSERHLKAISKGELFEARSDEEYDRLIESGAAVDPEREQQQRAEEIERRQAELEAEKDRLEQELRDLGGEGESLSEKKRPELNQIAAELGVPDPDQLPNKDAVVKEIEARRAAGVEPQP